MMRLGWVMVAAALAAGAPAFAGDGETIGGIPVVELPKREKMPIVVKWWLSVGEPGSMVSEVQSLNERLPRMVHVERLLDDGKPLRIRWKVEPSGDYPAQPSLFGGDYPSGTLELAAGERTGRIEVKTVATGRPDWNREFDVVLVDADNGRPVLGPYMLPVAPTFMVPGDRFCAPGRPDLCEQFDADAFSMEPERGR